MTSTTSINTTASLQAIPHSIENPTSTSGELEGRVFTSDPGCFLIELVKVICGFIQKIFCALCCCFSNESNQMPVENFSISALQPPAEVNSSPQLVITHEEVAQLNDEELLKLTTMDFPQEIRESVIQEAEQRGLEMRGVLENECNLWLHRYHIQGNKLSEQLELLSDFDIMFLLRFMNPPAYARRLLSEGLESRGINVSEVLTHELSATEQMFNDMSKVFSDRLLWVMKRLLTFRDIDPIQKWEINEDNQFTITLKKPLFLWGPVNNVSTGGVALLGEENEIKGRLVNGTLDQFNHNQLNQVLSQHSLPTPAHVNGLTIDSGVRAYCHFAWYLPKYVNGWHLLDLGSQQDWGNVSACGGTFGFNRTSVSSYSRIHQKFELIRAVPEGMDYTQFHG